MVMAAFGFQQTPSSFVINSGSDKMHEPKDRDEETQEFDEQYQESWALAQVSSWGSKSEIRREKKKEKEREKNSDLNFCVLCLWFLHIGGPGKPPDSLPG
jgi:hypothetical protein